VYWDQPDMGCPPSASHAGPIEIVVRRVSFDCADYGGGKDRTIRSDVIKLVRAILDPALKEAGGVVDGGRIKPRVAMR
jgi:hypothetical protein